jgi:predicted enzyme related to lactoylglutathione lyase
MGGAQTWFVWYELMTSDTAAAKAFYSNVAGWNTEDLPMPGMTYTLLRVGESQVGGLMPMPSEACAAGMRPCWVGYIAVDDVDTAAAKAQRLGGKIIGAPTDIPNVGRFAVVTDSLGAAFNLFKPNQTGQRAPVSNDTGQIGWHELHTTDWPKAFEFYAEMFGWLKGDTVDMGPMGSYQLVTCAGVPMGAMFNSPAARNARFWLFYVNVGDIDAAAARVGAGGGKIMQAPMAVPGDRWVIQAADPQGAGFALLGSRK